MSFDDIKPSLIGMFTAAQDNGSKEIVANFWGTEVYDATYFWGRVWKVFYSVVFFIPNLEGDCLIAALKKISALFLFHQNEIKIHVERYQAYLAKIEAGDKISDEDEDRFQAAKVTISNWNEATFGFIKHLREKPADFAFVLTKFDEEDKGFKAEYFDECADLQRFIQLEGVLPESTLPLQDLFLLSKGQLPADQTELMQWISEVNQLSGDQVSIIHKGLIALFKGKAPDVEYTLYNLGCTLFEKVDPEYEKQRQALQKGAKTNDYTLGEECPGIDERARSFVEEGRPFSILSFGPNAALYPCLVARAEKEKWGMPFVRHTLFNNGTLNTEKLYSIRERLREKQTFPKVIRYINTELRPHISLKPPFRPFLYHLQDIRCNVDGDLYLPLIAKKKQDPCLHYDEVEDFVLKETSTFSDYCIMMQESGLSKHAIAVYYRALFTYALQKRDGDFNPKQLATLREIHDITLYDRAQLVIDRAHTIREKLKKRTRNDQDEAVLVEALIKTHEACGAGAIAGTKRADEYERYLIDKTLENLQSIPKPNTSLLWGVLHYFTSS